MDLPEPAFRWLLENAASNEELASISNVCRSWRQKISDEIWKQAEIAAEDSERNESSQQILLLPSILRCLIRDNLADEGGSETFCLSWFHPYGIQTKQIPLDPAYDTEDDDEEIEYRGARRIGSPHHFAPSNQASYVGSEEEGKKGDRKPNSRMVASVGSRHSRRPKCEYVNCMYQWNSYKEAWEVLRPFGFAPSFVQPLVDKASEKSKKNTHKIKIGDRDKVKGRTHAVRGATIARPEGFCFCWDDTQEKLEIQLRDAQNGHTDENPAELRRLVRRRARRRREVQREVLPRVINCIPSALAYEPRSIPRAVQFLNIDFSHAVRLFTPPFPTGPIPTPITFFLVGIATEDGCFLSGLENRFEIGHLYPQNAHESLVERSPICICTEFETGPKAPGAVNTKARRQFKKDDAYNSDDSSFDVSMDGSNFDPPAKCACSFSGLGHAVEDEEEEDFGQICRGRRGPGIWHCYTIIVDGTSTMIRMDGVQEPLECSNGIPDKSVAHLDGLTIGADHTFDMSLCFGQGSDGEGEGAIAELVLFKGRLDMADILAMETDLMHRHGIEMPEHESNIILAEDVFFKRAHAMLSHPPRHKIFGDGAMSVPLRYMTKHRSVAWKQSNPVTGDKIQVSRIGTKSTESSSDW